MAIRVKYLKKMKVNFNKWKKLAKIQRLKDEKLRMKSSILAQIIQN